MSEASQATAPILSVRNVSKSYRDGQVQALCGVSLEIREGESISVTGPSGCGKSTLLHMLGGLDRPDQGQVYFRGHSIAELPSLDHFRAKEIGFVFQSFYLLPNLTAVENVQLPMFESALTPGQRMARATQLLTDVGLADRIGHLPSQLSNGQRQRVAIARAIANQPSILLADEPTGALDSNSGKEVMELLTKLNEQEKMTLIVVTHDAVIAARAQRRVQMLDGCVVSG
jgi:ABC-type lipoprotein export system ATPase subunit